jgi:seryl-tRNA synthetase
MLEHIEEIKEKDVKDFLHNPQDAEADGQQQESPSFLDALLDKGLLIATGVDGLYGRSALFEDVIERVNDMVSAWGAGKSIEVLRFPPAMSAKVLEESGYWKNCPDQVGAIFSFCGDDRAHQRLLKCLDNQEDWTEDVEPTRLVMTPAACYPVYPVMAARGALPTGGRIVDIFSYCFRHEPSIDPARMQMFRQREFVRMGSEDQVQQFREELIAFATEMVRALRLPASVEVANDPFFGRAGKIVAEIQRRQALKFELLIPGINDAAPTACASFNYHLDRFGSLWNLTTDTGEVAHTACVGFGLERIALSLFKHHGLDTNQWPDDVRKKLWKQKSPAATGSLRLVVR